MFLPGRSAERETAAKKLHFGRVETWCLQIIPAALKQGTDISVQEVQCGDPNCAPIDTMVTMFFESGGQGMFGLPMEAREVKREDLEHNFPPPDILEKWFRGEEAEWPPADKPPVAENMELRFGLGAAVECRIGAAEWAPGVVVALWYREPSWPNGSFAPYQIRLDDGRDLFAPADMDQIIRLRA